MRPNLLKGPRIHFPDSNINYLNRNLEQSGRVQESDISFISNSSQKLKPRKNGKLKCHFQTPNSPTEIYNETSKSDFIKTLKEDNSMSENKMVSTAWIKSKSKILVKGFTGLKNFKKVAQNFAQNFFNISKRNGRNNKSEHQKFLIINDKSFVQEELETLAGTTNSRSCLRKTKQWISEMKFPLIKSHSQFKLLWDCLMLGIIVFVCGVFSLELSFDIEVIGSFSLFETIKSVTVFFYIVDIMIKLNTPYYEYGLCVDDRQKILKYYINKMLFWDITSLAGLLLSYFTSPQLNFFKILFFFSYNNIRKLYKTLREQWKTGDLFELLLLLCRLVCVAHCVACMWHAIGYFKWDPDETSWIDPYIGYGWDSRYIVSLYWSITTLCTVGYGDIGPKNVVEMIFVSCIMLLGTLLYGYSINYVGALIEKIDKRSKALSEKMMIIDHYMEKSGIDENLKIKVKKYLQYIWNSDDKYIAQVEEILNKLPVHMKEEILLESRGRFLKGITILKQNFSEELIEKLALKIKLSRYSPCDIIYKQNQIENPSIFFVKEGEIELLHDPPNRNKSKNITAHPLKTVKVSGFCGELPFFTHAHFEETARSRSFSTVYQISREAFLEILMSFPRDYEKFCMVRDKILFSRVHLDLMTNCQFCNEKTHRIADCSNINPFSYIHRQLILNKLIYSKPQIRKPFFRNNRKEHCELKSLLGRKRIMKKAMTVRFNKDLMNIYSSINAKSDEITDEGEKKDTLPDHYGLDPFKMNGEIKETFQSIEHIRARSQTAIAPERDFFPIRFLSEKKIKTDYGNLEKKKTEITSLNIINPNMVDFLTKTVTIPEEKKEFGTIAQTPPKIQSKTFSFTTANSMMMKSKENRENAFKTVVSGRKNFKALVIQTTQRAKNEQKGINNINKSVVEKDSPKILKEIENNHLQTMQTISATPKLREKEIKTKELFLGDFESMKEYSNYFNEMNVTSILKEYSKKRPTKSKKHLKHMSKVGK